MTVEEIKKGVAQGRSGVANMTLATLRHIRDNSPKEWNALMKTESGPVINSLWDYLRSVTSDGEINQTAVEIGAKVGCAPENYPDPNTFYKAICWRMEGRECFVNEMTFMVGLMDTIYV